jgi:hypothetical protein
MGDGWPKLPQALSVLATFTVMLMVWIGTGMSVKINELELLLLLFELTATEMLELVFG